MSREVQLPGWHLVVPRDGGGAERCLASLDIIAPWFDDLGGLTQYRLDADLVRQHYGPGGFTPDLRFKDMVSPDGKWVNYEFWFGYVDP